MAEDAAVTLTGFEEFEEALNELPSRATQKNVVRRVLKAAAEPIADAAASMAPVESGRLAFSISVSTKGTRRARWKGVGGPGAVVVAIGPAGGTGALNYASFVEFGTVDTPAEPYMRPAWDGGKFGALERIKSGLRIEIDKAAARAARKAARAR